MRRNPRLHPRSVVPRPLDWLASREPSDNKALSYGFLAIGAFLFGCVGYVGGLLSAWGLAASTLVSLVSLTLARHHMENA